MTISMILAADEKGSIGKGGTLPWHLPEDLKRFKALTLGHVVIAGRRTHEDIVRRLGHPLPGRRTIVVSRRTSFVDGPDVECRHRLDDALDASDDVYVIGGAEIYRAALPRVTRIYLTRVFGDFNGDTRLDEGWLDGFTLTDAEPATEQYQFLTYERI
jgi:dihydrofolate reductase